jgi:hypothetical protein
MGTTTASQDRLIHRALHETRVSTLGVGDVQQLHIERMPEPGRVDRSHLARMSGFSFSIQRTARAGRLRIEPVKELARTRTVPAIDELLLTKPKDQPHSR